VKNPPITILPFGCKASAVMPPDGPAPGLKEVSAEPFSLSRLMMLKGVAGAVRAPTTTLPSGCKASALTTGLPTKLALKDVSREPFALTRTRPLTAAPL
jgi:hypothetical protein